MNAQTLILYVLTVWGFSQIVNTSFIMKPFRRWAARTFGPKVGVLVACSQCFGFWVALALAPFFPPLGVVEPRLLEIFLQANLASGVMVLLAALVDKRRYAHGPVGKRVRVAVGGDKGLEGYVVSCPEVGSVLVRLSITESWKDKDGNTMWTTQQVDREYREHFLDFISTGKNNTHKHSLVTEI